MIKQVWSMLSSHCMLKITGWTDILLQNQLTVLLRCLHVNMKSFLYFTLCFHAVTVVDKVMKNWILKPRAVKQQCCLSFLPKTLGWSYKFSFYDYREKELLREVQDAEQQNMSRVSYLFAVLSHWGTCTAQKCNTCCGRWMQQPVLL